MKHKINDRKNSILYQWNNTYGGSEDDYASGIVETSDGGLAIIGTTRSFGPGNDDIWLVKTDVSGKQIWSKMYGGFGKDIAAAIIETNDGGLAIVGQTSSIGGGSNDFWLIKTNNIGELQWNKTYGGSNEDFASTLIETSDGGLAIIGTTRSFGAGNYDMWLVKTDAFGDHQWNQTYGGSNPEWGTGLVQTNNDGFAIAGTTLTLGTRGMWLLKTDVSGTHQWNKTYGGSDNDGARDIIQTNDGGLAIVGRTETVGAGKLDMWLIKTNSQGELLWKQTYGGSSDDYANTLIQTSDGGFALAGKTWSFENEYMWLVKTNSLGNHQWNQTYGQTVGAEAWALIQSADGNFIIGGVIGDFRFGDLDMWLLKTNQYTNLASSEIVYQYIKNNPETLLATIPIILVIFLLYYIKKHNSIHGIKSDLYPV